MECGISRNNNNNNNVRIHIMQLHTPSNMSNSAYFYAMTLYLRMHAMCLWLTQFPKSPVVSIVRIQRHRIEK